MPADRIIRCQKKGDIMVIELESAGFAVLQQQNIKVYYENLVVGDYFADIIVNDL